MPRLRAGTSSEGYQSVGNMGFQVEGVEDLQASVSQIVTSSEEMARNIENAGNMYDKYLDTYKAVASEQDKMVVNMRNYSTTLNMVMVNMDLFTSRLERQRQLQGQITTELTTQKALIQAPQAPQVPAPTEEGGGAPVGGPSSARSLASTIGGVAASPVAGASRLQQFLPPQAQIAMLAVLPIMQEMGQSVSRMRQITRTGGMGMVEGMGGVGEAAQMDIAIRAAATAIPFVKEKYGSREELQSGAGLMFGLGGIRGEDLTTIMEELPKKAYEAGMKFSVAAEIMAKANRTMDLSTDEMLASFDEMADSARRAGVATNDYIKQVSKIAQDMAAYGANYSTVNRIMEEHHILLDKQRMSEQEMVAIITAGIRARKDEIAISQMLRDASKAAIEDRVKESDILKVQESITKTMVNVMQGTGDAMTFAKKTAEEFAGSIVEGRLQLETYTGVAKDLFTVFDIGAKGGRYFAEEVNAMAKRLHMDAPQLSKDIVGAAKQLALATGDPARSLQTAGAIFSAFAGDIKRMRVSSGDLVSITTTLSEKFRMTSGQAISVTRGMINLADATDTSVKTIAGWTLGFAERTRELFDDPNKSMSNAVRVVSEFGSILHSGKVTMADYEKVMRSQIDTLGTSASDVKTHFSTLSEVVEKTNVRMSELAKYSEETAKINRQYGFEQRIGISLFASFNDQIRAGVMSFQDMQSVMKGPAGMAEGPQMALVQAMIGDKDNPLGKILGTASSPLGQLELLRDIQMSLGSEGEMSGALEEAVRGSIGMKDFGKLGDQGIQQKLWTARKKFVADKMPPEGADIATKKGHLRKLWPMLGLGTMESRGAAAEDIMDQLLSDKPPSAEFLESLKNVPKEPGGTSPGDKMNQAANTQFDAAKLFMSGVKENELNKKKEAALIRLEKNLEKEAPDLQKYMVGGGGMARAVSGTTDMIIAAAKKGGLLSGVPEEEATQEVMAYLKGEKTGFPSTESDSDWLARSSTPMEKFLTLMSTEISKAASRLKEQEGEIEKRDQFTKRGVSVFVNIAGAEEIIKQDAKFTYEIMDAVRGMKERLKNTVVTKPAQ